MLPSRCLHAGNGGLDDIMGAGSSVQLWLGRLGFRVSDGHDMLWSGGGAAWLEVLGLEGVTMRSPTL